MEPIFQVLRSSKSLLVAIVLQEVFGVKPSLVRIVRASIMEVIPDQMEVAGLAPRITRFKTRQLHLAGKIVNSSVNQILEQYSEIHNKLGLLVSKLASGSLTKACSALLLEALVVKIRIKLIISKCGQIKNSNLMKMRATN